MSTRLEEITSRLAESGEQTAAFFQSLAADEWNVEVYSEGARWRVREMLAHFGTIERSMHWLFRNILEGGAGTPEDFDLDRFNNSQVAKIADLDPAELIARYRETRQETIRIVQSMRESDLDRRGRHPMHGYDRLERFIRWAYEHASLHLAEVQQALEAFRRAKLQGRA